MDAELDDGVMGDLAGAEAEVNELRAALEEAREATRAAEDKLRKRQDEEAERLRAYEQAAERVREAYAAERQRLEEARRVAEEGLRELDSKLQGFADDVPAAVPTIAERLADLSETIDVDRPEAGETPAYEDDWYRTLLQQSQNGGGDAVEVPEGE